MFTSSLSQVQTRPQVFESLCSGYRCECHCEKIEGDCCRAELRFIMMTFCQSIVCASDKKNHERQHLPARTCMLIVYYSLGLARIR